MAPSDTGYTYGTGWAALAQFRTFVLSTRTIA